MPFGDGRPSPAILNADLLDEQLAAFTSVMVKLCYWADIVSELGPHIASGLDARSLSEYIKLARFVRNSPHRQR